MKLGDKLKQNPRKMTNADASLQSIGVTDLMTMTLSELLAMAFTVTGITNKVNPILEIWDSKTEKSNELVGVISKWVVLQNITVNHINPHLPNHQYTRHNQPSTIQQPCNKSSPHVDHSAQSPFNLLQRVVDPHHWSNPGCYWTTQRSSWHFFATLLYKFWSANIMNISQQNPVTQQQHIFPK